MAIPVIGSAPNPAFRAEMIARSSSDDLDRIREHALATMLSLSYSKHTRSSDYAIWSAFVGEIDAEQRKRWLARSTDSN
jgi:hypothetical protein